ncbi:MAG: hypothetical protein ACHQ4H_17465 [Ktedonobacterales bacterium]
MTTRAGARSDMPERGSKRPRLTIDITPAMRRRIKAAAAMNDLTVREDVARILEEHVPVEPVGNQAERHHSTPESVERLFRTRERIMHGRVFTDDSTELLREARDERTEEL